MTIRTSSQSRQMKASGRQTENLVVEYLKDRGLRVERRRLTGVEDCGDIAGCDGWVIEVKKGGPSAMAEGLNELAIEVQNADKRFHEDAPHKGVVVCRRKGKPWAGDWYAVIRLSDFADWIQP